MTNMINSSDNCKVHKKSTFIIIEKKTDHKINLIINLTKITILYQNTVQEFYKIKNIRLTEYGVA